VDGRGIQERNELFGFQQEAGLIAGHSAHRRVDVVEDGDRNEIIFLQRNSEFIETLVHYPPFLTLHRLSRAHSQRERIAFDMRLSHPPIPRHQRCQQLIDMLQSLVPPLHANPLPNALEHPRDSVSFDVVKFSIDIFAKSVDDRLQFVLGLTAEFDPDDDQLQLV
jgi:hypothetical protein